MSISLNYYLDTRSLSEEDETKEASIKLTITKNRQTAYLSTGIKVLPRQWKNKRITGRPDKALLNDYLESFKSHARTLIYDARDTGRYIDMSATEIKKDLAERLGTVEVNVKKNQFLDLFDRFSENRHSERTKEIYRVTARKIRQIIPSSERISIEKIDLNWLEEFDEMLIARGNNSSTRNLDFRNIRAVIKYAIKHKIIKENPFEGFDMPTGASPDRALTITQLLRLKNAEVAPWERKYLDFFFLSFYLIGINTEDLLHLEKIEDGRINYVRAKTGRLLSIKVESEALSLINLYSGVKHLINPLDTYSNTHNWTSKVNAVLKNIAVRNGLPPVTMYWARHTWATIASADLGISLSTISDALGHQAEKKVTLRYIRRKNYDAIDEANRKVIDYVFSSSADSSTFS